MCWVAYVLSPLMCWVAHVMSPLCNEPLILLMWPLMYGVALAALYARPLVVELLAHCCLRAEALMD
jgi:hypothetical protein